MSEQEVHIELWQPTPRQDAFIAATESHQYTLYGGAAGGGKSFALRWFLIQYLIAAGNRFPGIRVGLFCENYPALRDRHLAKVRYEVPRELATYNETNHELTISPHLGGGVLCFRNLDDPSKYLSSEFAVIAVDELTRNEEQVFHLLRFRMRWPGINRPLFIAASNPGGPGHSWVKRYWIDRDFPPELKGVASQFAYIPAKASDNPYLPTGYYESLKTLPPDLARAYADGDWDVFAGQLFTEFRREIHVCEPFHIPNWWRRWGGNDPGYSDPGVWYWCAADGDGNVYVYREAIFSKVPYSDQARTVARSSEGETIDFWVTGMDAFTKHPETGKGPADYYEEGGLRNLCEPDHGAGCKARRCGIFHEYLRPYQDTAGRNTAKLHIFSNCRKLIEVIPNLPADEHRPEQVAECADDHYGDAIMYAVQAWHARRSSAPASQKYKQGTFGQILDHESIENPATKRKTFIFGT